MRKQLSVTTTGIIIAALAMSQFGGLAASADEITEQAPSLSAEVPAPAPVAEAPVAAQPAPVSEAPVVVETPAAPAPAVTEAVVATPAPAAEPVVTDKVADVALPAEESILVTDSESEPAPETARAAVTLVASDTTAPKLTVKPASIGADGRFRTISFSLYDAEKVDKVEINGVVKDLSNNVYSDVNGVKPGTFGAVEGTNTIVVFDVAGNTFSYTFVLDTTGPTATVKDGFVGTSGFYQNVSYKLFDASKVVSATLNGTVKQLSPNQYSDLNGITPGTFGAVEGLNTLVLEDSLGNQSTYTFVLDTTKPAITTPAGGLVNGVETFHITQVEANPAKTYVEFQQLSGGKWVKLTGAWFYDTNVSDFTVDTSLYPEGASQIKISTWDKANNQSGASFGLTVDNVGPTVTVKPESIGSDGVFQNVSFKLYDLNKIDKVTINGVLKDLSDNTWSDVNGLKPGTFGAVEGVNELVVYDVAGNTTIVTFVIDTTTPVINIPSGNLVNGVETFNITQDEANPARAYVEFQQLVDGKWKKVAGQEFLNTNSFDLTVDTTKFADGKYQIKVSTWDKTGNHTSAVSARTVDNTNPVITIKPESIGQDGVYESISFKLSDAKNIDRVELNGVIKDLTNNPWSDVNNVKPGVYGAVEGTNTIVVFDEAGNSTSLTFVLKVKKAEVPPVVTPPTDTTPTDPEDNTDDPTDETPGDDEGTIPGTPINPGDDTVNLPDLGGNDENKGTETVIIPINSSTITPAAAANTAATSNAAQSNKLPNTGTDIEGPLLGGLGLLLAGVALKGRKRLFGHKA